MADIDLVIKIPENEYRHIKEIYEKNDIVESTYSYIYYGTPLPKGHGRLIDTDVLADGFEDNYEFCEVVNATPTIIEADKEE